MSAIETWLLSCLVNSLWQIPVLFVAGLLVARALRRLGPEAEHRTWTTVLVLSAALPSSPSIPFDGLLSGFTLHRVAQPRRRPCHRADGRRCRCHRLRPLTRTARAHRVRLCRPLPLVRCPLSLAMLRGSASSVATPPPSRSPAKPPPSGFVALVDSVSATVAVATSSRTFGPMTFGVAHKLVILPAAALLPNRRSHRPRRGHRPRICPHPPQRLREEPSLRAHRSARAATTRSSG